MLLPIIGLALIGGFVGKKYLGEVFEGWSGGSPHPLEAHESMLAARWLAFLITAVATGGVAYLISVLVR